MHSLDLDSINWDNPSQQDIVDLYYARMWAISETVAEYIRIDDKPTRWFIDDIRTNFLRYTKMSRERFDTLIDEGQYILSLWGIPEIFVVYPECGFGNDAGDGESVEAHIFTSNDMAEEFANNYATENSLVLTIMQSEYGVFRDASKLISDTFFDIMTPGRRNNAYKG